MFPPRDVANAFFACGYDDNENVLEWDAFELTEDEYGALLEWWRIEHPAARADRLGLSGSDFARWFSAAIPYAGHPGGRSVVGWTSPIPREIR